MFRRVFRRARVFVRGRSLREDDYGVFAEGLEGRGRLGEVVVVRTGDVEVVRREVVVVGRKVVVQVRAEEGVVFVVVALERGAEGKGLVVRMGNPGVLEEIGRVEVEIRRREGVVVVGSRGVGRGVVFGDRVARG